MIFMTESNWDYITRIDFDPDNLDEEDNKLIKEYHKMRYKKAIAPMIKKLEKELKSPKAKEKLNKEDHRNFLKNLFEEKANGRNLKVRYENGEIYPQDIFPPDIAFIQFAEPHVLITDLSDVNADWYRLRNIIPDFANEAFLTYEIGCWLASISSSINCCEYILKYELFRNLKTTNTNLLQTAIKDENLTLGRLINDAKYNCLGLLKIESLHDDLNYINHVRISIYHSSPEKAKKVNQKGKIEVERFAPITDDMMMPIISFRVYSIMTNLINHFYNKEKSLEYYKECVNDWKRKTNIDENRK